MKMIVRAAALALYFNAAMACDVLARTSSPNSPGTPMPNGLIPIFIAMYLLPLVLTISAWRVRSRLKKQAALASKLTTLLSKHDEAWRPDIVRKRVDKIFPAVQAALTAEDLSIAADFLSDAGCLQIERMVAVRRELKLRKVIKDPQLNSVRAVFVIDKPGHQNDQLKVEIEGAFFDERVARKTGEVAGGGLGLQKIAELWTLSRNQEGEWVLDAVEVGSAMNAAILHGGSSLTDVPIEDL
jgi:hypothetical protein